jgi:hypothetical protein
MIIIVFVLGLFFNVLYWITKLTYIQFAWSSVIHHQFNDVMGWFVFLNFLMVATLYADTIIKWEEWKVKKQHVLRLLAMVLLACSWGGSILISVLELYTLGGIQ